MVDPPAKSYEDSAASTASEPASAAEPYDFDGNYCCDCGMDCGLGGCTAFDGMS